MQFLIAFCLFIYYITRLLIEKKQTCESNKRFNNFRATKSIVSPDEKIFEIESDFKKRPYEIIKILSNELEYIFGDKYEALFRSFPLRDGYLLARLNDIHNIWNIAFIVWVSKCGYVVGTSFKTKRQIIYGFWDDTYQRKNSRAVIIKMGKVVNENLKGRLRGDSMTIYIYTDPLGEEYIEYKFELDSGVCKGYGMPVSCYPLEK